MDPQPLGIVAVGGNALQSDPNRADVLSQWETAHVTAGHVADLAATGMRLVVTHGNGPQVGHELRRSEAAEPDVPRLPTDMAVAHTQGGIGYMLACAIDDALEARGIDRQSVALVTRALVAEDDPAFENPSKPIGSYMSVTQALRMARVRGWRVREISTRRWRRVVASPRPLSVLEIDPIRQLVDSGTVVIAGGGGGVSVVRSGDRLRGVPAVIDKDLVSSLIARELGASLFLIATNVERIAVAFGTPQQAWLDQLTVDDARRYLADGQFPPGSMGPKITAAVEYLEAVPHGRAIVSSIDRLADAWRGDAGTEILAAAAREAAFTPLGGA